MTRKDFQLIADALKAGFEDYSSDEYQGVKKMVIGSMAQHLMHTNKNFDAPRFIRACEGWEKEA
tara:strand:- start:183 stop:374 length:192 start_codon:yes stop_codon:yes gene_type:complete